MTTNDPLLPIRLDPKHLRGEDLPPMAMWPAEMLPRPIKSNRNLVWYSGKDLICCVYECDDGAVDFVDLPYDEHVYLLQGQATLISENGETSVYAAGDAFVAPKGWTGTWEMSGGYRELICFAAPSLLAAARKWWPPAER